MATGRKRDGRRQRGTKDRVLQARIPQKLDDELRDRAERLGLSVSTLVRNTLLNTFDLVEGVVTDSAQLSRVLQGKGGPAARSPHPATTRETAGDASVVVGWQEAHLNINGVCDKCNAILPRGERAAVGVPAQSRPVLLCLACLRTLRSPAREQGEQEAQGGKIRRGVQQAGHSGPDD